MRIVWIKVLRSEENRDSEEYGGRKEVVIFLDIYSFRDRYTYGGGSEEK